MPPRRRNEVRSHLRSLEKIELVEVATLMGIKRPEKLESKELIGQMEKVLGNRFVETGKTLGKPGKEGVAKIVWDTKDEVYRVKKQFRSTKSPNTLRKEADLQQIAANSGLSPKVLEVDVENKSIIMERMDCTLVDLLKKQNNRLSEEQQKCILSLFRKLDQIGIFHGDPNPLNIMRFNSKRWGIIDFGFAKKIEGAKDLKMYNGKPNQCLMTVGLLVLLKKRQIDLNNFPILLEAVPKAARAQFELGSSHVN